MTLFWQLAQDLVRLGRIAALQKPNGGVRGIIAGDMIRRLVARTMLKPFLFKQVVTQFSRPAWSLIWCFFLVFRPVGRWLPQALGLIAVGQRLAPLSRARTPLSQGKRWSCFFCCGDLWGPTFLVWIHADVPVSPPQRQVVGSRSRVRRRRVHCSRGDRRCSHGPDGVPMVDLTTTDDILCSICGLADGVLDHFPCCHAPVHQECQGYCSSCDIEDISDMGDSEEECVVCRCGMDAHDRFTLPCCFHDLHLDCVLRSFQACGAKCPLCQISLDHVAQSEQFQAIVGSRSDVMMQEPIPEPVASISVVAPPPVWPLCCNRLGGPPDFVPLDDRRMEWSPIHPAASGSNSIWIGQWICRSCSRSLRVTDLPPLPPVACPDCQHVADSVLDVVSAEVSSICMNCRRGVPCPPTAATEVPLPHVVDWFTSGGLARLCPLYGWNTSSLSRPGEGTQSWLFCPLISLGLRSLEINLGVVAFSTGPRAPVPDSQFQFWSHNAANIINAFAAHFAALPRDDPVALALSQSRSWGSSGAHLDAGLQEQATPPHILSMLEVWIASQVAQFQDPELPSVDPVVVDDAQPRAAPTVLPSLHRHVPGGSPTTDFGAVPRHLFPCALVVHGRPLINSSPAHSPVLHFPTHLRVHHHLHRLVRPLRLPLCPVLLQAFFRSTPSPRALAQLSSQPIRQQQAPRRSLARIV